MIIRNSRVRWRKTQQKNFQFIIMLLLELLLNLQIAKRLNILCINYYNNKNGKKSEPWSVLRLHVFVGTVDDVAVVNLVQQQQRHFLVVLQAERRQSNMGFASCFIFKILIRLKLFFLILFYLAGYA